MSQYEPNAIFSAIRFDSPDMLVSVIEDDPANLNIVNEDGMTPLMEAVTRGRADLVRILINKGADVNGNIQGFTPILVAAQEGQTEIVQILINGNADLNAKNPDGLSPLMAATRDGHLDVVKSLIGNGADINATTNQGSNALTFAQHFGQQEVADYIQNKMLENYWGDPKRKQEMDDEFARMKKEAEDLLNG